MQSKSLTIIFKFSYSDLPLPPGLKYICGLTFEKRYSKKILHSTWDRGCGKDFEVICAIGPGKALGAQFSPVLLVALCLLTVAPDAALMCLGNHSSCTQCLFV